MVLVKPWAHGQIVPDGWAERHRPIIAGFFCDTAVVRRKTGRTDSGDGLGTQVDVWTDVTPAGGVRALMQVKHTQGLDQRAKVRVTRDGPPLDGLRANVWENGVPARFCAR